MENAYAIAIQRDENAETTNRQDVEKRLVELTQSNVAHTQDVLRSLTVAGGKRIRPTMAIQYGSHLGIDPQRLLAYAAAVELIHTGTLLQDDVIDHSPTRRGQPTAWARWGAAAGILGGDILYMRALSHLMQRGLYIAAQDLADTMARLAEGEMLQDRLSFNPTPNEEDVRLVSERKTGELFAWIARQLARDADLDLEVASRWGMLLGYGFQLADDLIDFADKSDAAVGKPQHKDLREGNVTLPVLRAAKKDPDLAQTISEAFRYRTEPYFKEAYRALAKTCAVQETQDELLLLGRELDFLGRRWMGDAAVIAQDLVTKALFRSA